MKCGLIIHVDCILRLLQYKEACKKKNDFVDITEYILYLLETKERCFVYIFMYICNIISKHKYTNFFFCKQDQVTFLVAYFHGY